MMPGRLLYALSGLLLYSLPLAAETVQPDQRWAWSPNAGWLNARPLGAGGPGLHVDGGVVSGWLYSPNVGWMSASCLNTGSCDNVSYGLRLKAIPNQPELFRLTGYFWSENAGWIVAHCDTTQSCGSVDFGLQVDRQSGLIEGFAWSENLGWISFSCTDTASCGQSPYGIGLSSEVLVQGFSRIFGDRFEF